jgi:hypothetical protein
VVAVSLKKKVLKQGASRLLRSVLGPMTLAGIMALAVLGCSALLPAGNVPVVIRLALPVLVGVATYAALGFLFARRAIGDVFLFFRRR